MEISLAEIRYPRQDRDLIKQLRTELLAPGRTRLESVIQDLTGFWMESLHTDISALRGSGLSSSLRTSASAPREWLGVPTIWDRYKSEGMSATDEFTA